jgi:galactokinase
MEDLKQYRTFISDVDFRRSRHVLAENTRVIDAKQALQRMDLPHFGQLMYESHDSLDRDYEVTCKELNIVVDLARNLEGVYGARMTGGGFGGCTINLVESKMVPEFQATVAREYETQTGLSPQIFVCSAAAGASEVAI